MHILHISPYYAPAYRFGGVVSMLEGLAQAQVTAGHRVTVLTTDAETLQRRYQGERDTVRDGVHVRRVPNRIYALRRYNLSTPFAMRAEAQAILPTADIVHLHEFRSLEALLVIPVAAQYGVPIVLSPHGTLTHHTGRSVLKSLWDYGLSPRIVPHINHVIALSATEADDVQTCWQQFGHTVPVSIVPNGVTLADYRNLPDAAAFRARYQLGAGKVVLFMGRLHTRKGVDLLAQAFTRAAIPNTKLLIAGSDEGMLSILQAYARADDNIILSDFLTGAERFAALAAADLFALPAIGEGVSMAMLEAMAAGVPVLLSPGCHFPQAAQAQAGIIVPPTVDTIAQGLQALLSDQDRLAQMGDKARQLIAAHYTWDAISAQLSALYNRLITS